MGTLSVRQLAHPRQRRPGELLFVLGVPKITGAVQGIINPIAIR
jgi:hypothetical protein